VRTKHQLDIFKRPSGLLTPGKAAVKFSSQQEAPFGVFAANAIQLVSALMAAFTDSFHREITLPPLWVRPDEKLLVAQFAAEKTPSAFRHDANTASTTMHHRHRHHDHHNPPLFSFEHVET